MALKKVKKLSSDDLKAARKGGYKKKKPTIPKTIKTETQYNAAVDRVNAWIQAVQQKAKAYREEEEMKIKGKKLKSSLSGLGR